MLIVVQLVSGQSKSDKIYDVFSGKEGVSNFSFSKSMIDAIDIDLGDDESDAEIWLLGGKKKFSECHVFINNEEDDQMRFVVSFYGDFTVNDLEGLKKTGKGFSNDD